MKDEGSRLSVSKRHAFSVPDKKRILHAWRPWLSGVVGTESTTGIVHFYNLCYNTAISRAKIGQDTQIEKWAQYGQCHIMQYVIVTYAYGIVKAGRCFFFTNYSQLHSLCDTDLHTIKKNRFKELVFAK